MSNDITVRPLRYSVTILPDGSRRIDTGAQFYFTAGDHWIIIKVVVATGNPTGWRVIPYGGAGLGSLAHACEQAGIPHAIFPRRRDAVEALEAVVAAQ